MERVQLYGYTCLLIGLALRYIIGKRRFRRRGIGGLQHFSSYGRALITIFLEWVVKWVANILLLTGILLLVIG